MSLSHIPISTGTGRINLLQPDAEAADIGIDTIAHALAQQTRYTGHALRPVSLAEHALLSVEILERHDITTPRVLMAAMMADAHAAVVGTASPPMMALLGTAWSTVADRWAAALRAEYGLTDTFREHGHLVWMARQFAEAVELQQLVPSRTPSAGFFVEPDGIFLRERDHMTWSDWRQAWLDKWDELCFAQQQEGVA